MSVTKRAPVLPTTGQWARPFASRPVPFCQVSTTLGGYVRSMCCGKWPIDSTVDIRNVKPDDVCPCCATGGADTVTWVYPPRES